MLNVKRCKVCGEEKSIDLFFKCNKSRDAIRSRCKECDGVSNLYKRNYEPCTLKTYAEYLENYKDIDKSKYNKK